eukprot:1936149-Pleurochrysis_carterae.AAC.1
MRRVRIPLRSGCANPTPAAGSSHRFLTSSRARAETRCTQLCALGALTSAHALAETRRCISKPRLAPAARIPARSRCQA